MYIKQYRTAWNSIDSIPSQVRARRKDSFQIETASKPRRGNISEKQQEINN